MSSKGEGGRGKHGDDTASEHRISAASEGPKETDAGVSTKSDNSKPKDSETKKRTSNVDNNGGESSSVDSTSEGKSGSGSGGGYSADCSGASDPDQWSSDEGVNKRGALLSGAGTAAEQLERLDIGDDKRSNSKPEVKTGQDARPEADEAGPEQVPKANSHHRSSKSSGKSKAHHHKSSSRRGSKQQHQEPEDDMMDEDAPEQSPSPGLPVKSPDMIDIDAIIQARARQDEENATFFAQSPGALPQWNGLRVGNPMDPRIDLSQVSILPAGTSLFGGDPLNRTPKPPPPPFQQDEQKEQQEGDRTQHDSMVSTSLVPPATAAPYLIESYVQLMEAVRPFFMSHGVPYMGPQPQQAQLDQQQQQEGEQQQQDQQQQDSSEGFTSFFTTTHSSQQSGSSSGEGQQRRQQQPQIGSVAGSSYHGPAHADKAASDGEAEEDTNKSDSSSMVVLARTKRKHQKKGEEESAASSKQAEGERRRRVRIQEGEPKGDAEEGETESSNSLDQKPQAQVRAPVAAAPVAAPAVNPNGGGESPESSGSSSSAAQEMDDGPRGGGGGDAFQRGAFHQHHHHHHHAGGVPPRIVTDVSSSATGPSNTSSGSGSAGNTGSGSNQGSSGSGNEKNSSEEGGGKGSSEEGGGKGGSSEEGGGKGGSASEEQAAQGGDSAESPGDGGSDQSDSKSKPRPVAAAGKAEHHHQHHNHSHNEPNGPTATGSSAAKAAVKAAEMESNEAVRERKLQDKKRKRIEMRREYEAQQHIGSSGSSDRKEDSLESGERKPEFLFRPGKPVTFDEVLNFSKIARVVIQASPPFLVVHSNAAFTRLTGIDSHKVVGRPIKSVLSLPNDMVVGTDRRQAPAGENSSSSVSGNPQSSEAQDGVAARERTNNDRGRGRASSRQNKRAETLERLVAASGFGRLHVLQVLSKHSQQLVGKSVAFLTESSTVPGAASRTDVARAAGAAEYHSNQHQPRQQQLVANEQSLSSGASTMTRRISCRASIAPIVSAPDLPMANSIYGAADEESVEGKRRKLSVGDSSTPSPSRTRGGGTEADQDAKRRKVQSSDPFSASLRMRYSSGGSKEQQQQQARRLITHYVIQLEVEADRVQKQGSVGSLSSNSTSVEARLLGLTKAEARHHRSVTTGRDGNNEEEESIATGGGAVDEDGGGSESTTLTKEAVAAVG